MAWTRGADARGRAGRLACRRARTVLAPIWLTDCCSSAGVDVSWLTERRKCTACSSRVAACSLLGLRRSLRFSHLTFKCSGPQGNRRCRPTAASFATRSAAPSADKPCVGCRLRCIRQRRTGGTVTQVVPTNVAASASRRCRWQCPPRTGTGFSPSHGGTLACAAAHSQTEATAGAPRACAHARIASSSSLSVSCQLRP